MPINEPSGAVILLMKALISPDNAAAKSAAYAALDGDGDRAGELVAIASGVGAPISADEAGLIVSTFDEEKASGVTGQITDDIDFGAQVFGALS
jgi:phosphomannomutase